MSLDLLPGDEHEAIIDATRSALAGDRLDWTTCAELGWFGLGLPEEAGGVGYGATEEVLLHREIGRSLRGGPFIATALGARLAAGTDADIAAAVLSGRAPVGLLAGSGPQRLLVDGSVDGYAIAITDEGAELYSHEALELGEAAAPIDAEATVVEVAVIGAPSARVEGGQLARHAELLCAAAFTGIAERARDLSVAHAIEREQFGRPIGVHQAVKHPCADMAIRAELALAQVTVAAALCDAAGTPQAEERPDDLSAALGDEIEAAVSVARAAALKGSWATVQIHGGMGFTTEHPAHRLVTRTHVIDRLRPGS